MLASPCIVLTYAIVTAPGITLLPFSGWENCSASIT